MGSIRLRGVGAEVFRRPHTQGGDEIPIASMETGCYGALVTTTPMTLSSQTSV
jgi:hypothetical protein